MTRDDKFHYDCSKLDQWEIVFAHGQRLGLYLHFKLQETEINDNRVGHELKASNVATSLDGGALGPERKLYCRELIARLSHHLALNWNIGEENTQTTAEVCDMVKYLPHLDPYDHHIVIHTYPDWQERVYVPLLGEKSLLTGASLQNNWNQTHQRTLKWVTESAAAGRPWVVDNDKQGGADTGVPPDLGYEGFDGRRKDGKVVQTADDIRKATLWGNLMAGGAGVEYYFGYQFPQNDLNCEDWRSRENSWTYARIALEFFRDHKLPFWEMRNAKALVGNAGNDNSKFCLAKRGQLYLVYHRDVEHLVAWIQNLWIYASDFIPYNQDRIPGWSRELSDLNCTVVQFQHVDRTSGSPKSPDQFDRILVIRPGDGVFRPQGCLGHGLLIWCGGDSA